MVCGWGLQFLDSWVSPRRIGLCREATQAPLGTRVPQAWAVSAAQAGLRRDRPQNEKSQGALGTASPETRELGCPVSDRRQHASQYTCDEREPMLFGITPLPLPNPIEPLAGVGGAGIGEGECSAVAGSQRRSGPIGVGERIFVFHPIDPAALRRQR